MGFVTTYSSSHKKDTLLSMGDDFLSVTGSLPCLVLSRDFTGVRCFEILGTSAVLWLLWFSFFRLLGNRRFFHFWLVFLSFPFKPLRTDNSWKQSKNPRPPHIFKNHVGENGNKGGLNWSRLNTVVSFSSTSPPNQPWTKNLNKLRTTILGTWLGGTRSWMMTLN